MHWNILAYGIPIFGLVKAFNALDPATYKKYAEAPESAHADAVKRIAERVLSAEHQAGEYCDRVRQMVEALPDSVPVKNIAALIESRLKVAEIRHEMPVHSTGTDLDLNATQGAFYIGVHPEVEQAAIDAMAWIATHEVCHILEGDWVELLGVKAIASLAAAILSTMALGLTLFPTVGATLLANAAAHVAMSRRAEERADNFANKHCTADELEKAAAFLEHTKNKREIGLSSTIGEIIRYAFHPSEDDRIAKIRTSMALGSAAPKTA